MQIQPPKKHKLVTRSWFHLLVRAGLIGSARSLVDQRSVAYKASWHDARESAESGGTIYYKHYYGNKLFE